MHRSIRSLLATVAGAGLVGLTLTVVIARPAAAATPTLGAQAITVSSPSAGATTANVIRWQRDAGGRYTQVGAAIHARVGTLGIGQAHEGVPRTPAGMFTLTQAFGNTPTNGTRLPYFQAGQYDWWNELSGSRGYNTRMHQVASPGGASENLYRAGAVYSHAVVIDYNRDPVRAGAGSAFFLHVTNGHSTAGCVAIAASALDTVMRWMDPAQHPVILIGVGAAATARITRADAAAATHDPVGALSSVTGGAATARMVGWAYDPDARTTPLVIDVYLDGSLRGRFTRSSAARPDIAAAKHVGPDQGYDATLAKLPAGPHTICVTARNVGAGANVSLGCRAVTVKPVS